MPESQPAFTAMRLIAGKTYRVRKSFEDYDGRQHAIDEQWLYLSKDFLPYEDGLTLHIEQNGRKGTIRLQWREETQASIIDTFSDFVQEI